MICSNVTQQLSEADRQNFHELYLKYQRRVYSICFRMTQNSEESEDLTQEVFIHLFRTIGSFRGDSAFTTWLHRLTVNHVLMHFRKRRTRPEMTSVDGELPVRIAAGTSNPNRMNVADRILLSEVMAKLPHGYREAVVLHDIEGLDFPLFRLARSSSSSSNDP
jgi:RNA polymerase sigma-70 factor (ECF subfamily)